MRERGHDEFMGFKEDPTETLPPGQLRRALFKMLLPNQDDFKHGDHTYSMLEYVRAQADANFDQPAVTDMMTEALQGLWDMTVQHAQRKLGWITDRIHMVVVVTYPGFFEGEAFVKLTSAMQEVQFGNFTNVDVRYLPEHSAAVHGTLFFYRDRLWDVHAVRLPLPHVW